MYKPIGVTMGELMKQVKEMNPDRPVCFSGRLDPMAHGLVQILYDEDVKKCREYDKKDKTYEFEVIPNISTDTTDILGLITNTEVNDKNIVNEFMEYNGRTYEQEYHIYSSMTIKKKPLWWYANNGKLNEIVIPRKEVTIYNINHLDTRVIKGNEMKQSILERLDKMKDHAEFRTREIIEQWNNYDFDDEYEIHKFRTQVSSGTYIRQLVKDVDSMLLVNDIQRVII